MARFNLISALLILTALGCHAHNEKGVSLAKKIGQDQGSMGTADPVRVFRIFGSLQPMLAVYNHEGTLQAVHKVMIIEKGADFWPMVREDARVSREPSYFAVSRTPVSLAAAKAQQASFRVDLYRGSPAHRSVVGHDLMVTFAGVSYLAQGATRGTHIMVGDQSEVHAVPYQASNDLVSFAITDGISATPGRWADAVLSPMGSRPATTAMGCTQNYSGEIIPSGNQDSAEFWGICEKKAPALPSPGE